MNSKIKIYKRYVNENIYSELDEIGELKTETDKYYLKIVCSTREKMLKSILLFHKNIKNNQFDKAKEQIVLYMKHRKLHLNQLKKLKKRHEEPFENINLQALGEYMFLVLKFCQ